jgi:hypothetical protein
MKHDYAMAEINLLEGELNQDDIKTIRHALRMMQKLQQPSEGMQKKATMFINEVPYMSVMGYFKSMLEQAEREIEG